MKDDTKEGKIEGRREGRKEGRKEGRNVRQGDRSRILRVSPRGGHVTTARTISVRNGSRARTIFSKKCQYSKNNFHYEITVP